MPMSYHGGENFDYESKLMLDNTTGRPVSKQLLLMRLKLRINKLILGLGMKTNKKPLDVDPETNLPEA